MGKAQEAAVGGIHKGMGIEADPYAPGGSKSAEAGGAGVRPATTSGAEEGHQAKAGGQDESDLVDEADPISMQLPEPAGAKPAKAKAGTRDKAVVGKPKRADDGTLIRFPPPPPEVTFKPNVPDTDQVRAGREAQARRAAENPLDYQTIKKGASADQRARARAAEFSPLYGEWHGLNTAEKRRARVEDIVNQHLAEAGLPRVEVKLSDRASGTGSLNPKSGKIDLSEADFANNDLSIDAYAALVDTAVHEARHALHHFRSIRAAMMENVFDPGAKVPAHWVDAARDANAGTRPAEDLVPLSPKYQEALSIYDQTHGSGAKERTRIIRARKRLKREYTEARDRVNDYPAGSPMHTAAKAEARAAWERYRKMHNKYVALPQEIDAMRRGGATRVAMVERLTLEQQITRAEVASVSAEQRYRNLEARYQAATGATTGGSGAPVSLALERAYRKARNRYLAAENKLQLLRAKLASLGTPTTPQAQGAAEAAARETPATAEPAGPDADEADRPGTEPGAQDVSSRFDLSETESAGQAGQVAIVDPSVSRLPPKEQLKPQEVATLDRVVLRDEFAGRTFRKSADESYDFVDSKGFKYDALGAGARAQYQTIDRSFLDQITRHINKQGLDYTIIDMTGYSPAQIRVVRMYVDLYHGTDAHRILRIGF